MQERWQQQVIKVGLVGALSLSSSWVMWQAIAPLPVQAYVSRADVMLDVQPEEAYATFVSRAETVARAAVQRSFDRDILISEVYITISGQRQGQSSPVLLVQVSRNQWRARPDSRYWATSFPSAKVLLGFGVTPRSPQAPPTAATRPATPLIQPAPVLIRSPATSPSNNTLPVLPRPGTRTVPTNVPTTPLPPVR